METSWPALVVVMATVIETPPAPAEMLPAVQRFVPSKKPPVIGARSGKLYARLASTTPFAPTRASTRSTVAAGVVPRPRGDVASAPTTAS